MKKLYTKKKKKFKHDLVLHEKLIFEMKILLKAMPEPSPAKTKITIEKNSANAALMASGWLASPGEPIAILLIGIFVEFLFSSSSSFS